MLSTRSTAETSSGSSSAGRSRRPRAPSPAVASCRRAATLPMPTGRTSSSSGPTSDVGICGAELREPGGDVLDRARAGEQVALTEVATDFAQPRELLGAFDALGDGRHAEAARERDDGGHEGAIAAAARESRSEAAIDLERVERHAPQQAERRPARAEIVERDRDAEAAYRSEHVGETFDVLDALALGQLDEQAPGIEPRRRQGIPDIHREFALERVPGRDVAAHRDRLAVQRREPLAQTAGLGQGEALDVGDQTRLLGERHEIQRRYHLAPAPPAQ